MSNRTSKIHLTTAAAEQAMKQRASDPHLKAGIVPVIRRFGTLRPLAPNLKELSSREIEDIVNTLLNEEQRTALSELQEIGTWDMGSQWLEGDFASVFS
ncbi:MAG: hypothetical protein R2827_11825 [Bdellovibrionales bacterium]